MRKAWASAYLPDLSIAYRPGRKSTLLQPGQDSIPYIRTMKVYVAVATRASVFSSLFVVISLCWVEAISHRCAAAGIMKILSNKGICGWVKLLLDDHEDPWHLYYVMCAGDLLESKTKRNLPTCAKGSVMRSGKRSVYTDVTIQVEKSVINLKMFELRCSGRNIKENRFLKVGVFHTLQIHPGMTVTLHKDLWDKASIDRIKLACDVSKRPGIIVLLIQQELGHLCHITNSLTLVRQKFKVRYSMKTKECVDLRKEQAEKFYTSIYEAVVKCVNFDVISTFVVAGPAFYKDDLLRHIFRLAEVKANKDILQNKNKFTTMRCSSAYKLALREITTIDAVANLARGIRLNSDKEIMDHFNTVMFKSPDKAFYGCKQVEYIISVNAAKIFMINDNLYMSIDVRERIKYTDIVDRAKVAGARVHILSSMHLPGEQLAILGGIAVVSNRPFPQLDIELSEDWSKLESQLDNLIRELEQI